MGKQVAYEWVVETTTDDDFNDVEDCDFWDTAADCLRVMETEAPEGHFYGFALVRNRYNPLDECDLQDRQYAYVENGALPDEFEDGAAIPARYRDELARAIGGAK
jgi:hypothetical protein